MRLATTATRDGDHWIINGAKDCIANAPIAKLIAVEAQTDKGAALFLVPRETRRASRSPSSPSRAGITAPAASFR